MFHMAFGKSDENMLEAVVVRPDEEIILMCIISAMSATTMASAASSTIQIARLYAVVGVTIIEM